MIFSPNTIRNSAFAETFLKQYRKQKLKLLSLTHWLDEVGDYSGTQRPKYVLESDGSAVINSSHITSQTVVTKKGTATATVSTGQIDIGSGWIGEVVLSDGTVYFLEESSGTDFYDSSGAGNDATLTGTGTWAIKRDLTLINNANKYGYTLTGNVIIPVDLSNLALNAEGDALQFVGRVASDMKFINSNCIEINNTSDFAQCNFDLTGVTITSFEGTATPSIDESNDKILFSSGIGTCYNVVLSNGLEFPFAEGFGTTSYAENDQTKQIIWTGGATWSTQDVFHHNVNEGFTEGVNMIAQSHQIGKAPWQTYVNGTGQTAIITLNAGLNPFGNLEATKLELDCTDDSFSNNRSAIRISSSAISDNINYVASVYIKAFEAVDIGKTMRVVAEGLGLGSVANIVTLTNEYQRISVIGQKKFSRIDFLFECRGTMTSQAVNIFLWGAEVKVGLIPSNKIQRTDSSRTIDAQLPYKVANAYSNAATNGHNQAETKLKQVVFREDFGESSLHFDQSDLSSEVIAYADIANTANVFLDTFTNVKIDLETFSPVGIINSQNRKSNGLRTNRDTLFRANE
jgi:hypothetical protein